MSDMWSKKKRSEMMSLIKSKGNKSTELRLIEIFKAYGITGWRRGQKLPGRPDFTFRKERVVIFVDGCFWHGCPECYKRPSTNTEFWDEKFRKNKKRDEKVSRELRQMGWKVVRIWEHQLKHSGRVSGIIKRALNGNAQKAQPFNSLKD